MMAATDAGDGGEDSIQEIWLAAELGCHGGQAAESTFTLPEGFVIPASVHLSPEWTHPGCESR